MLFWIVGAIEDAIMHAAARPTLSLLLRRAPNYLDRFGTYEGRRCTSN